MIQNNEGLNTARMIANNGQVFIEDTSEHPGVFFGFQPSLIGCKISAITISDKDGNTIDETDADVSTWIGTTADLDSFMSAGLVNGKKGYITSITLSSGACTLYKDTMSI